MAFVFDEVWVNNGQLVVAEDTVSIHLMHLVREQIE